MILFIPVVGQAQMSESERVSEMIEVVDRRGSIRLFVTFDAEYFRGYRSDEQGNLDYYSATLSEMYIRFELKTAHLNIRYEREFGKSRDQAGLYLTADPIALRFLLETPMLRNVAYSKGSRIGIPWQNSSN
ncbi:MAG: hypothetical protein LAT57_14205 [Balneolales bacterium]|nr:hypothetical protein [Balneolales bacterium]